MTAKTRMDKRKTKTARFTTKKNDGSKEEIFYRIKYNNCIMHLQNVVK